MLMCGLLVPIYSPYAIAQIGILQAHLIGVVQALVFFAFAWMWPQLTLPVFSKKIATISLYISLWANWLGTFFVGIFGAGNTGAAVTKLVAPLIVVAYGWTMVPQVYAILMMLTALLFWFFTYSDPAHKNSTTVSMREQLTVLKDPKVWKYSQYYSIVFGGYVALALWMTKYYITEYDFDLKTAALMAAAFSIPGGVLRAVGGYFSDKFGAHTITWWVLWVSLVCLFFLSYPQTDISIITISGPQTFHVGLNATLFTVIMFTMGIAFAIGKASVFKYISDDYPQNIGVVSGVVGLAGGMGGFLMPIMFGALVDLTGVRSSAFMLMFGIVWVSLIWMYWSEVRPVKIGRHHERQAKNKAVII